jgi:hypothetical protein
VEIQKVKGRPIFPALNSEAMSSLKATSWAGVMGSKGIQNFAESVDFFGLQ